MNSSAWVEIAAIMAIAVFTQMGKRSIMSRIKNRLFTNGVASIALMLVFYPGLVHRGSISLHSGYDLCYSRNNDIARTVP